MATIGYKFEGSAVFTFTDEDKAEESKRLGPKSISSRQ
jgi:hypothetical protein